GVSRGAGRHHPDAGGADLPDRARVRAEHAEGPRQRVGREPAGGVHALAEPDDLHAPVHVDELAGPAVRVGDEQPQRGGTAVYGPDGNGVLTGPSLPAPAAVLARTTGLGRAGGLAQAWRPAHGTAALGSAGTATHGPARHHSPAASRASRPSGLAPGAASSCATSACRHFTRSGMPPALGVPGGSGSTPLARAASSRRAR